jgi:hypothetical protein
MSIFQMTGIPKAKISLMATEEEIYFLNQIASELRISRAKVLRMIVFKEEIMKYDKQIDLPIGKDV